MHPSIRATINDAMTLKEMGVDFGFIERYFSDASFRADVDAEIEANRALAHAAIDKGMEPINARQRARWEREDGE